MLLEFEINSQLDIPIYQQIVDKIRSGVKMGTLCPGQQLPTVQEMAQQLSIAKGTIKRAYDELEYQGLIEKIQGRGTFICYQPENSGSRKEQAMAAIDEMLDKLESMGFSPMEINIFLTLKQRERTEDVSMIRAALVECNPETLSSMADQLRTIKGIDLYTYLLDTLREYPYKLDEDTDLVITTAEHAEFLQSILPDRKKLALVALRLSVDTLAGIVKLRPGTNVGILASSARFGDLVYGACRKFGKSLNIFQPRLMDLSLDIALFLCDKDVIFAPVNYEKYCPETIVGMLKSFDKQGKLLQFSYEMDEGSFLYLEEKLHQLRKEKIS